MPATDAGRARLPAGQSTVDDLEITVGAPAPHPLFVRARPLLDRLTRENLWRLGVSAGIAFIAMQAIDLFARPYNFFDLNIYHGAVQWWTAGGPLYDFIAPGTTLGFTYPPFAALAMLPMGLLPGAVAGWMNALAAIGALGLILGWILVPVADRCGWPRWYVLAVALPLAVATEPVRETIGYGQVNLLLAVLIVADMVGMRNRFRMETDTAFAAGARATHGGGLRSTVRALTVRAWRTGALAGIGVGLATAIKLTPALFIVYFLVARQWRVAATAVATALSATALAFLVAGDESSAYFTRVMWETNRIGVVDATPNQSLAGVLARAYDSPTTPTLMWFAFAMLLLVLGLSRALTAHREGDEVTAFTLVGLTANAICPISWTHHLVFVVPAIMVLVDHGLRRRGAARGLAERGLATRRLAGRGPWGFPSLAGLRHFAGAAALLALFVYSPIWPFEHHLDKGVSHYADGLFGALAENSLALAVIALIALLPWRPGAEPAFHDEPALRAAAAVARRRLAAQVRGY